MSAPFYSLIIVNERARFSSSLINKLDSSMEQMIARQALRCFVFQATVFVSGIGTMVADFSCSSRHP